MKQHRKKIKQGLAFLLLLFIVCTCVPVCYATESQETQDAEKAEKEKKKQEELDRLEKERKDTLDAIDDLKDSISDTKKNIADLKAEKSTIQSYIAQLDQEISTLSGKITAFEKKIAEKNSDIEATKEELLDAQAQCEEQYESMKKRIQFIYETPVTSLIDVLCTTGSITEFINRADQVASMSDYDREMMEKLIETREEIARKEETLEAELEELEMMQEELESQKKKINSSLNAKKGELSVTATALGDASDTKEDYEKQLVEQEKLLNEIEDQIAKAAKPDVYEGTVTGFIWPCPGYSRISSYFGPRPQPTPGASTNHKGVDLAASFGTAILASAAGKVTTAQYSNSAGNYVVVAHGNGISTVYMHCSSLLVSAGDTVEQGQVIAKVGSTGYSTGNHLHFGVIKNGSYVDPLGYVSP